MRKLLYKSLNTKISPLAYLFTLQTLCWGMSFVFFNDLPGVKHTVLYTESALIGVSWWGVLATAAACLLAGGMAIRCQWACTVGSAGLWVAWVFASVIYIAGGYWFLLALALLSVLMYGYLYLASSLGLLWVDTDE